MLKNGEGPVVILDWIALLVRVRPEGGNGPPDGRQIDVIMGVRTPEPANHVADLKIEEEEQHGHAGGAIATELGAEAGHRAHGAETIEDGGVGRRGREAQAGVRPDGRGGRAKHLAILVRNEVPSEMNN